MDKLRAFEFFTVLLPAGLVVLISSYFLGLKVPSELADDNLLVIVLFLPVCYFMGYFLSKFGLKIESIIDKCRKKEHPIVKILDKFPNVKSEIQQLYPELDDLKDKEKRTDAEKKSEIENRSDAIFVKCRVFLYQQSFGERAQSIATQATFFRNLVPSMLILIICLIVGFFCENPLQISPYQLISIIACLLVMLYFSRVFSQNLYKDWFKEVLENMDVYFKFSK